MGTNEFMTFSEIPILTLAKTRKGQVMQRALKQTINDPQIVVGSLNRNSISFR
jgi:hypothetical protein